MVILSSLLILLIIVNDIKDAHFTCLKLAGSLLLVALVDHVHVLILPILIEYVHNHFVLLKILDHEISCVYNLALNVYVVVQ